MTALRVGAAAAITLAGAAAVAAPACGSDARLGVVLALAGAWLLCSSARALRRDGGMDASTAKPSGSAPSVDRLLASLVVALGLLHRLDAGARGGRFAIVEIVMVVGGAYLFLGDAATGRAQAERTSAGRTG